MKISSYLIPVVWSDSIPILYRYEKRKKTCEQIFVKDTNNMKQQIVL